MQLLASPQVRAILLMMTLLFSSCGDDVKKIPEIDPAFGQYITAYTSGVINRESTIRIRLAEEYDSSIKTGDPIDKELFDFDPSIEGKTRWADKRTIEFIPDEPLAPGTVYDGEFELSELLQVPDKLETFPFLFQTIKPDYQVFIDGLKPVDIKSPEVQQLSGRILTNDAVDTTALKHILSATQNDRELNVVWKHTKANVHSFVVNGIIRGEQAGEVELAWDGDKINVEKEGDETIEIPALGDFKVTDIKVFQSPEQYLEVRFSDGIKKDQNLEGIISLEGITGLSYSIDGNVISVYLPNRTSGNKKLTITTGLKNYMGYKMAEAEERVVVLEELKPGVRLVGNGTILPKSNGLLYAFEAVSLRAVDVHISRIFENNIPQFLQTNNLSGNGEMYRVGREILRKTVRLDEGGKTDFSSWNRYFLDLSELIQVEPGAIYRVELRYKKIHASYNCPGETELDELTEVVESYEDPWERPQPDYYYHDNYWDGEYNWRERDNPCHDMYYRHKRMASNVLASDLGIITKIGADKKVHVVVNNLVNTKPVSGAQLEFYDYQKQLIGSITTDGDGMAEIPLKSRPFLLVAKKGTQRGYLKLRDGEALSLSKFDVSGTTVQRGIKGFVYGERGVWRPGDSIYLSFLMEDEEGLIPAGHPVSMNLINPQGQVVEKIVKRKGINGFYDFRTATDAEAPTGNWGARIYVGNRSFYKPLKVETVKPNRLKIYLDFGDQLIEKDNEEARGDLQVKWLHGAIARNLKVKVQVTVNQIRTSFSKFKGYHFDDAIRSFYAEEETVFEDRVDENGQADFAAQLNVGDAAPGMLKAYFTTRVFEESGNFSIDRFSIPYSPYSSYVGIKVPEGHMYRGTLETDQNHKVEVATVDAKGNPISRNKLEVKVYQLTWRWWWDSYDSDIANYLARTSTVALLDTVISTSKGKGAFNLRINRPKWGRFLVRVTDPESGHSCGKIVYIDWPYWARANRTSNEFATMLNFSSDKKNYSVGEPVKITFPSTAGGRALVCVESGTKVLEKFWVETVEGETKCEFLTKDDMAPNVFVHVSLLQPHSKTENDLPIRLYGVIPVLVENPETHLSPVIQSANVWRPETKVNVSVKEEKGKAMTYTLAIVDDGLLDLTRFKTPQPWDHFYAREALGVKTWDLYDQVIGAYGAELNRIFSVGGDAEGDKKKGAKANRFKPMVRFIGPFKLKKGGTNQHQIDIPNYVGSVRVMVVAGQDEAYGHADKTVTVRKPLMVLGTLPRVLGPTEMVKLPVNVFAMEDHVKNVSVEIIPNEMFEVRGPKKRQIRFDRIGDEVVNFELAVANKLGVGKVRMVVRSGKERATHEIEIDVRSPNPKVTDVVEGVVEPGKAWESGFAFKGIEGTNSGIVEFSTLPPIDLDRRLKYLIRYPHGCIEQTTSSVFPQLHLDKLLDLNNDFKIAIAENIQAGLKRISKFQTSNGGFAYWPGNASDSEWGSNYAGHFMLEAERKGYKLPMGMKEQWIGYQRRKAREWEPITYHSGYYGYHHNDQLQQAYRLFVLALARSAELGAMNRLREHPNLANTARWRLAAAYELVGQHEVALELINKSTYDIEDYTELTYTFGSGIRDKAMILEALCLSNEKAKAATLAKEVAERLSSQHWMNTQTTAYCLVAMARFAGSASLDKTIHFTYQIDNGKVIPGKSDAPLYRVELSEEDLPTGGDFRVENKGKGILYARIITEGIPVVGDQSYSASNLKIQVRYTDMIGAVIDPTQIEQGSDFMAVVDVTNPGTRGYLSEMALSQIFPSGWEIHNSRMDEFVSTIESDRPTYQDIRDDRVYTYYNISAKHTLTFRFQLNATYMGRFYLPTVLSEAMYDHTINARVPGRWVEVVEPGE